MTTATAHHIRPKAEEVTLFRYRAAAEDGDGAGAEAVTRSMTYKPTLVLPFYSHTRRDEVEASVDASLGIDRRSFSNLYPCSLALPAHQRRLNGSFTRLPPFLLRRIPISFFFSFLFS